MNRAGELWEHSNLRYYVLSKTEDGTGWHAIRLHDYNDEPRFTVLDEEFFTQEWWEKIA